MEKLFVKSTRKIENVTTRFKRFLIDKINWDRRLVGIKGARGTGKTTMLLQYISEKYGPSDEVLYVSLDDIYFSENKLVDLADNFVKMGGKFLFLDEVHKYPNWSREIKNIYDDYPGLKIVFTGSSILEIDKSESDLSRRSVIYELPVLSVREYIALKHSIETKAHSLSDILMNHKEIAIQINKKIKPIKELNDYNRRGTYPFFLEAGNEYSNHIERIINLILETDLPASTSIDFNSIIKLKQLLYVISESVPFQPNISKLSIKTGVTRDTLIRYLSYLEKAHLISLLRSNTKGISKMAKPDKIYLNNNNLMFALQPGLVNPGTVRETFFQNQLSVAHKVDLPAKGDFIVDDKYVFEVGGKNKTQKQIIDIPNSYVVSDDLEYGFQNRIPLWLFGFLY
ncbi:MAG: AAA family ATPase [Bacteroidetes bacterium]|nr:MAG: AAA family ATPase [Bacteroidota bacterium]